MPPSLRSSARKCFAWGPSNHQSCNLRLPSSIVRNGSRVAAVMQSISPPVEDTTGDCSSILFVADISDSACLLYFSTSQGNASVWPKSERLNRSTRSYYPDAHAPAARCRQSMRRMLHLRA